MTPEEQRIAIAEVRGFRWVEPNTLSSEPGGLMSPSGEWLIRTWNKEASMRSRDVLRELPDYPQDLNAMHEAENFLTTLGTAAMCNALDTIVDRDQMEKTAWTFRATAAQRAEAFLKTIGKWEQTDKQPTPAQ